MKTEPIQTSAPLVLLHETSPDRALLIARSLIFVADAMPDDAGLNCFIENSHDGCYFPGQARFTGALMRFHWTGPKTSEPSTLDHECDVLFDHYPHRAIVFAGPTQHLRLISVELRTGYSFEGCTIKPSVPWRSPLNFRAWLYWAQGLSANWEKQQGEVIKREMDSIVSQQPPIHIAAS